jgi:hypothetical protein
MVFGTFKARPRKPNKPLIFIELKTKTVCNHDLRTNARTRAQARNRACTRARTHAVTDKAFNFQKSSVSPIGFTHVSAHTLKNTSLDGLVEMRNPEHATTQTTQEPKHAHTHERTQAPRKPNKPLIFIEKRKLFTSSFHHVLRTYARTRAHTHARTRAHTHARTQAPRKPNKPLIFIEKRKLFA